MLVKGATVHGIFVIELVIEWLWLKPICPIVNWTFNNKNMCVSKETIIGSDNGLSLDRRQALIWTNAGILLIGPLATNFSELLIKIHIFSFKECIWKYSLENVGHLFSVSIS